MPPAASHPSPNHPCPSDTPRLPRTVTPRDSPRSCADPSHNRPCSDAACGTPGAASAVAADAAPDPPARETTDDPIPDRNPGAAYVLGRHAPHRAPPPQPTAIPHSCPTARMTTRPGRRTGHTPGAGIRSPTAPAPGHQRASCRPDEGQTTRSLLRPRWDSTASSCGPAAQRPCNSPSPGSRELRALALASAFVPEWLISPVRAQTGAASPPLRRRLPRPHAGRHQRLADRAKNSS